jgi:hypothetical protein
MPPEPPVPPVEPPVPAGVPPVPAAPLPPVLVEPPVPLVPGFESLEHPFVTAKLHAAVVARISARPAKRVETKSCLIIAKRSS